MEHLGAFAVLQTYLFEVLGEGRTPLPRRRDCIACRGNRAWAGRTRTHARR